MGLVANRKSAMTLHSGSLDPMSHRVRIVLAEKNISVNIVDVAPDENLSEDLLELNPYNSVPTLVDRDLALYTSQIIIEYLDERYPHPPLMPIDPVLRAQARTFLYRIERDWYGLLDNLQSKEAQVVENARKILRDSLTAVAPIFLQKPFFMSDEFSLIDCNAAPILWRLKSYDVDLPSQAQPLTDYANRLFAREGFQNSLTAAERDLGYL